MYPVPWDSAINFPSALLLHSCLTVLLKEALNAAVILHRLFLRFWPEKQKTQRPIHLIRTSIVLDAYTSILSKDLDGELAELYFTNTGFVLLAVSLASSVAMNLLLSSLLLNTIIAGTFGLTFLASLVNHEKNLTLPIMALRRAGRFIWSDTPFVNFFSLIYIATVLHGKSTLRLQDYITFRSIAVLELVFMKAKLAASTPEHQIELMRRLTGSEWVAASAKLDHQVLQVSTTVAERNNMVPFTTRQRLAVMLIKTSIGFQLGCLQGRLGPAECPLPAVGCFAQGDSRDWAIYRVSEDVMMIADRFGETSPKGKRGRLVAKAHGVLLRRLGKIRVIYLLKNKDPIGPNSTTTWHSNINLVTGVSEEWLKSSFHSAETQETCVVIGNHW